MIFYQDREIEISENTVLLSGGYSGHANFGDVAQLKSMLTWYKQKHIEAVVIIRLDSIYDEDFIKKLYEWFEVKAFLFYAPIVFDVSKYNLKISKKFTCKNFHLYGGGMINSFWAKDIIKLCEAIITRFQSTNYILSGQQIDEIGAKELVTHFQHYPPSLVGVRDLHSLQNLKNEKIESHYSFDDAFEELTQLKNNFKLIETDQKEIYLHFNISPYVSDNLHALIDDFTNTLEKVKQAFPQAKYKLLLTYLDSRILSIVDTLGVIGSLDYHFDMNEVTLINLASISLKNHKEKPIEISKNSLLFVSSYHTAMFMQMLGINTFMFAGNNYYEQKREGLKLNNITLDSLLKNTPQKCFEQERLLTRNKWLQRLSTALDKNLIQKKDTFNDIYPKTQIIFKRKQIQTNLESSLNQINKNALISNKIFGIGWAKTGTTTLGEALKILGYKHKTQDFSLVDDVMRGEYKNIKTELIHHDSFDDWPWIILYKQLDVLSPNSKFILTVRDEDSWLKSYRNMLSNEGVAKTSTNKIRSFLYGLEFPNVTDKALLNRYRQHIQNVKNYFKERPNDLLIIDWSKSDDWKELSNFLNKNIPSTSFPHSNKGLYCNTHSNLKKEV